MHKNKISHEAAQLLLNKLHQENAIVIAYFQLIGVEIKIRGFVHAITATQGLQIIERQGDDPRGLPTGYLVTDIGNPIGIQCSFFYGDKRELPEETRDQVSTMLGEAVLVIHPPNGGELRIFFTV